MRSNVRQRVPELMGLALLFLTLVGCAERAAPREGGKAKSVVQPRKQPPAAQDSVRAAIQILESSDDYEALTKAALEVVGSQSAVQVDKLLAFLQDPRFLARIDSDASHTVSPRPLERVLAAVARLPDGRGEAAFVALMSSQDFMDRDSYRPQWIVVAARNIREPSEAFLDRVEKDAAANGVGTTTVIQTFAHLRSPKAGERMKRWFSRLGDPTDKLANLCEFIDIRNDETVVKLCGEVLADPKEVTSVKKMAVEVLFADAPLRDLLPYTMNAVKPPPRYEAATGTLEQLALAARLASAVELSGSLKANVKKSTLEIERILEFRRSDGPKKVAKLIADFDSSNFTTREQATRALEKFGALAEPGLRTALDAKPNSEVKRRIEEVLAKLEPAAKDPEVRPADKEAVFKGLEKLFKQQKK